MTQCTADFETGVNGNTLATANPGSATAFNFVDLAGGNTAVYDSSRAAQGLLSAKFDNTASPASNCDIRWTTALGTVTDHYGRMYVYFTANPALRTDLVKGRNAGTEAWRLAVNLNGKVALYATGNTLVATGSTSISLNAWVRIEYHVVHDVVNGSMQALLYNDPNSSTITETITASTVNTRASSDDAFFGNNQASSALVIWMDAVVAGATSYPGPVPVVTPSTENLAPVIYGRGAA